MHVQPSSSSLNLRPSQFSFQVWWGHFTIGFLSQKVHWKLKSEFWIPHWPVCVLGLLQGTKRHYTPPDFSSKTLKDQGLYMLPHHWSCFNYSVLFVIIINVSWNVLVLVFKIVSAVHRGVRTKRLYEYIQYWQTLFNCRSLEFTSQPCTTFCKKRHSISYWLVLMLFK